MKTILISGGGGYLGTHLTQVLLKKNRILSIRGLGKNDLIDQSSFNKILGSSNIEFNDNKLKRIKEHFFFGRRH